MDSIVVGNRRALEFRCRVRSATPDERYFAGADLLDRELVPVDSILPMVSADGESKIGPLDEVGRSVVREGKFTAGELLRIDQLHPDRRLAAPQRVDLFRRA